MSPTPFFTQHIDRNLWSSACTDYTSEGDYSDFLCVQRTTSLHLLRSHPIHPLQITTRKDSPLQNFYIAPPHKKKDWTRKKMKWCNHTNMTPPSGHGAWDSVKVKDYILSSYPVFSRNTFPKPSFMGWSPVLYLLGDMVKIYCPFMQTNKLECSCRTLVLISLSWAMVLNRTDMESTFEPGCSLPKCVCCVLGSWQGLFFFFSFFDPTSWYISLIWLSTQI